MSIGSWFSRVEGGFIKMFSNDEQAVIEFLTPLAQQIEAAVKSLGKATFAEGLQVLKDAAAQAVAAGATAAATGGNAVAAAEAKFLEVGASEGITAVHNAESAAIKAAVAVAQTAFAAIPATPSV